MRARHRTLAALAALTAGAALAALTQPRAGLAAPTQRAAEVARIRAHFDSVERELLARDVASLAPAQRANRARNLRTLAAYRDRGEFPRNRDFPGALVPYFVDETGVLCAVAHLLATSGRRDIVDRVAAANNNVWVGDLAADTAFTAWLDAQGLTLAEAARIQMPYMGPPPEGEQATATANGVNTAASVAVAALGVTSMLLDAPAGTRRSAWRTALGLAAGAGGLALAATRRDATGAPLAVGVATGAVGAASLGVAGWRLTHRGATPSPARSSASVAAPQHAQPRTPVVAAGLVGPGLGVAVTF